MIIVSATASYNVDNCAVVTSVLRGEIVGKDAKLFGRIRILRSEASQPAGNFSVIIVSTVQQKVVVPFTAPVDRNTTKAIRLCHSGAKQNELIWIAKNQRQLGHLLGFNPVAPG